MAGQTRQEELSSLHLQGKAREEMRGDPEHSGNSACGEFSGFLPLCYNNKVRTSLEEEDEPPHREETRIAGGGAVSSSENLFPIVIRCHLPAGIRVSLSP